MNVWHFITSRIPRESRRFYSTITIASIFITIFLQALSLDSSSKILDKQIFHPISFVLRGLLNPKALDPRIKIFALDDSSIEYLKSSDLKLSDWGQLIQVLGSPSGSHVIIDKLFDIPAASSEITMFKSAVNNLKKSRIGLITFANPREIQGRDTIPNENVEILQRRIFNNRSIAKSFMNSSTPKNIYGAPKEILNEFDVFGVANYKGDHYADPFFRTNQDLLVPHLSLSIVGNLDFSQFPPTIANNPIALNREGKILINFFNPSIYRKHTFSLKQVIINMREKKEIPLIEAGDFVVILPAMYTGHTDFVNSPFGPIPGGFHLIALLNSALTSDWIKEIEDPGYYVLLWGALGFLISLWMTSSKSMLTVVTTIVFTLTLSLAAFIYLNISFPCLIYLAAFIVCAISGFILKGHLSALEESRKSRELEVGALVQKSFFPTPNATAVTSEHCTILGIFEPATECGGDWWDTFHVQGYTYILIGDAIGHGVPAALVTSVAFAATKSIELEIERSKINFSPADILNELNKILLSMKSKLGQMTFFVAKVQDQTGRCWYANGGNQPPFLIKKSGENNQFKILPSLGNILGEFEQQKYDDHTFILEDGDKLILFTDGLFENRVASERSQLGKSWLRKVIKDHSQRPASEFITSVWAEYKTAIGSTVPDDDTTLVAIEYRK